ncbi:GIY-YIG nuclease family protein [Mesorhizobium sp.]|uniref:GIY-YIG nuclease family protein n=1 Tax=Mesorhizobium sp. TaxID=1871066 RepID=UPI0025BCDA85|nr:GIY-YIG nuclease family protein [Mesorhizobium sp.]
MPTWGVAPLDLNEAAMALGISPAELRALAKKHGHYEPRGPVKKVFYPEHMQKLKYVLAPPVAQTPLEVIRYHVTERIPAASLIEFESFITQEFDGNIYLIRCNDRIKIGFTTHWARRFRVLKTACPYPVTVIAVMAGNRTLEQFLHIVFENLRRHGEWFDEQGELATMVAAIEALPK